MTSPEQPKPPVAEGEIIAGKYRVEQILGQGGMGVVVAAMHIHLRQRVAIKFLLPDAGAEFVTRFMREARASAKLKSEHIARVLDVAELPNGAPYMVMEYLDGSDLSRVIRKRGALPFDDAVDYLLQAGEAIAEAHSVGIIHRDLKPANLFLTKAADGSATVKVLDFGISKDTSEAGGEDEMALTRTTAVLGSPYYMAPEQMRSTRTVDPRADIWSIGVILYQLVTKAVPFKAGGFVELAMMVINDEPVSPSQLRPDLPPALEAAILRCLRKNPGDRFASMAELAAAIAPFGRAGAITSAERIARTQGAPVPLLERPSRLSLVPGPPSAISGAGPSSLRSGASSGASSGPSMGLPHESDARLEPAQAQGAPQGTTGGRQIAAPATQPSFASPGQAALAADAQGRQALPPPAGQAAQAPYPVAPAVSAPLPLAPPPTPSIPPPSPLTGTGMPSAPPPAAITGSSTGKEPAHAATASTWAGAARATPAPPARRTGRAMVVAGVVLGALAAAGSVLALRARTGAAVSAATQAPPHLADTPEHPPAPVAPVDPGAPPVANVIPAQGITREPLPAAPLGRAPGGPASIEVTAGTVAPALGAPVATTTTSPGGRLGPPGKGVTGSQAAPAATAAAVAAPAAPTAAPAAPPPAPAPAPAPVPTQKKSVLDMDIQ